MSSPRTPGEKIDVTKPDTLSEAQQAALALFYPSGVATGQRRYVVSKLRDLGQLTDSSAEVERRHGRWRDAFPIATCTLTLHAFVKHWDALAPPKPNPYLGEKNDD